MFIGKSIIIKFVLVFIVSIQLLKVELVAQDGADTTKALDELVTLRGSVRDKLKSGTKVLILLSHPLKEGHLTDDFHLLTGFLVQEEGAVRFLLLVGVQNDGRAFARRLELPAGGVKVLEDD